MLQGTWLWAKQIKINSNNIEDKDVIKFPVDMTQNTESHLVQTRDAHSFT